MSSSYEILYYKDKKDHSPVEDFLKELPAKDRIKVFAHIQLLKERGFLPFPYTSDIKDAKKLRELRVRFSFKMYRVIYFMFKGKKIVLLHGFTKTTGKIPPYEIEVSQKRMEDFLKREGSQSDQEKG